MKELAEKLTHKGVKAKYAIHPVAGLDNELFCMDKTMMVFGDAKKVVEEMVKAVD